MATSIYFNGRVTSIPGSYSEVDTSGLAQIGLGATGIVACIGECEGGQPAVIHKISNPSKVSRTFQDGDLLEAGLLLFDPSKDPSIAGGAQEVQFWKVNPATQSTLALLDVDGAACLTFTSDDYGAFTTKVSVDISDATGGVGKAVSVSYNGDTDLFDDIGATAPITISFSDSARDVVMSFDKTTGLSATLSESVAAIDDYLGSVSTLGLDGDITVQPAAAGVLTFVSADAGDSQVLTLYGILSTGAAGSETITLNGATPVASVGLYSHLIGVVFPSVTTGLITITDAAVVTIATGTDTFGMLAPSSDIELAISQAITVSSSGASTQPILLIGTAGGVPTIEKLTLTGTTPKVSTTTNWTALAYVGLGRMEAAQTLTLGGDFWQSGDNVRLVSSDAADTTQTATVYGLSVAGVVQSEDVVLTGTAPVNTSATFGKVYGVLLSVATAGNITVSGTGSTPAVSAFSITASSLTAGLTSYSTAVESTGSALSWLSSTSGTALVIGINSVGAAALEEIDLSGIGTTTTVWSKVTAIASPFATGAVIQYTLPLWTLSAALYPMLSDWEAFLSAQSAFGYTTTATNTLTYDITKLDEFTSSALTSSAALPLYAVQQAIIDTVSASPFVTVTATAGSKKAPANTANPQFLAGGIEGVTTFSAWQAALDAFRNVRVNTIVVLTSDEAVHAAVLSHCAFMAGAGRSERDCVLGSDSGITMAAAKSRSIALNSRHARLTTQDIVRYNTAGVKEQFPPYFTACLAAGMQAGSSIGTALTFKYANTLDVIGDDATYTVVDDANELIQAGLCLIEKVPNVGFRWLRNVTTHQIDNNLAYCEASVNEAVNFAVYELRTALETIVGRQGFSGTVNAALGVSVGLLGELIAAGAITSYRNLTVELTDDVMTVDVELAPIIPVNFIKTTVHLVSASFSA